MRLPAGGTRCPMGNATAIAAAMEVYMPAIPGVAVGRAGFRQATEFAGIIIDPEHAIAPAQAAIAFDHDGWRMGQRDRDRAAMAACNGIAA